MWARWNGHKKLKIVRNICFVVYLWAQVWMVCVCVCVLIMFEEDPVLTPIIIPVCQLVADDRSDSSIVHRSRSRNVELGCFYKDSAVTCLVSPGEPPLISAYWGCTWGYSHVHA